MAQTTTTADTDWDDDGDKTNDRNLMLLIATTTVSVVNGLTIADNSFPTNCDTADERASPDCDDGLVETVFIRDDVSTGAELRTISMATGRGAQTIADEGTEGLDLVVSKDARFDRNGGLTLVYNGGGAALVEGEELELLITVNGDTGLANRTTSGKVKIVVTATNSAVIAPEAKSYTVPENDDTIGGLILKSTIVVDLTGLASDPEGVAVKYNVLDSDVPFVVRDSTSLIFDELVGNIVPAMPDDDALTGDQSVPADPPDGSKCTDEDGIYGCGNIKYEFDVNASDGVASNDKVIKVTVIVEVNEPPTVTDAVSVDATSGAYSYAGIAEINDDAQLVSILDLSVVVTDLDPTDTLAYSLHPIPDAAGDTKPLPFELRVDDGKIKLIVVPSSDAETLEYDFILKVNDGYNAPESEVVGEDADPTDLVVTVSLTVTVVRPDLAYPTLRINVDEEFTGDIVDDNGDTVTVISAIDATDFEIIGDSGADGSTTALANGTLDFDVDSSTGVVSVVEARDYDVENAILSPSLTVSASNDDGDDLGNITVIIIVDAVNEPPVIQALVDEPWWVKENANDNDPVLTSATDPDPDSPVQVMADDVDTGDTVTFSLSSADADKPFKIDSASGKISVKGIDALNHETTPSYTVTVIASDGGTLPDGSPSQDTMRIAIAVTDANEMPYFIDENDDPLPSDHPTLAVGMTENVPVGHEVADYNAADPDENDILTFTLKNATDVGEFFALDMHTGTLTVKKGLDYETQATYLIEINVTDSQNATDEVQVVVTLTNVNDESPKFGVVPPVTSVSVPENTARGTFLANYGATDADGDTVKYSLKGANAKSFMISDTGDLMTLESLDADRQVPCGAGGCTVTVTANDMPDAESGAPVASHKGPATAAVIITITAIEDSVSTLDVTKANPVPGTEMGNPMSALAGTKIGSDEYLWNMLDCPKMKALVDSDDETIYCKMWDGLSAKAQGVVSGALGKDAEERPGDLPASGGSGPENFVETEWANWGTILRIEVTAESPAVDCGDSDNRCVVVKIESDSADTDIWLEAYRSGSQENKFVAALMLVERSDGETASASATEAVYKHSDGGVARLKVDEEDEIEIEFGNLRGSIEIENEDPEISNFAPEHEAAFNDPDVDYIFRVMDDNSGLPEAEDLPDVDGDDAYTPVVALISKGQCETVDNVTSTGEARIVELEKNNYEVVKDTEGMLDGRSLYCRGDEQDGEFDAKGTGYGFAPIRDDRDFDKIDNGYDVETTIVLDENEIFYVTFIACDNAGNCTFYDPDGNDDAVELAEITVDIDEPEFVEARTGLTWDSTDNEYDDNKSFIQVIFDDLTNLNVATVEIDDFVVEGHTVKDVHIFENPDDDDVDWADSGDYGADGHPNKREIDRYRDLENAVFLELEDELLADETPDVAIVPNGVEDKAGNEQDDGDKEADDWISPTFTIVSMVSTLETSQSEVLAGDDDEVTVVVTSDERLQSTRPTVTVTYVNAPSGPAGRVDTKGTEDCDDGTGTRERGEIVHEGNDKCLDSDAATGGNLNNNVEKVSNTEWIVTITEPKATGYYNFHIEGSDRSPQNNDGSEGVGPGAIVSDFFDADGDVNVDDAIFFEGDINLPKPEVRVSGVSVEDNEADVEFRSPLFVELDFAANHSDNCRNVDDDERMANCTNENSEYAEDNFDDIVVTSFMLDGVDITDSVKTTDNQSFLVSLESISIGDHTATVQAVDQAGNVFEDTLEIDFEVNDRDPFTKRLSPGWNLVSLPGEPADSSIAAVFGPGVEVRTIYSYDPVIPGGWQVAVRETLDSDWQGDLTEINGQHGYWVLSDAIQDWEVSIPRLAGGAAGTGTPIQPPVIPLYAGWNLIPVTDVKGNALDAGITVSADTYLQSLDEGVVPARVLGFDTIRNEWYTVLDGDMTGPGMGTNLEIGSGYWVFVREAISLVPGGVAGGASGD